MKIAALTELLREQERLTREFENLMEQLEQHPIIKLVDPTASDAFQSLQHSRAISQEAIEKRDEMVVFLQDFNVRLQANVNYLQRVLKEFDEQDEEV
ncbi:hypothetical protein [Deinococcus hopiensis]|uniref:Uncharacterized protein n=1 Tax=Deinococcus hopiensis KR-140 TaxID=695939 RepID=A0A1W1UUH2_9DEIO|nr:hypothetical protein [Deinococcus hopiensis]SMB84686.1 hypothetical protein SAMN00790413_05239 [Deinococcus hopiensis KR-140]